MFLVFNTGAVCKVIGVCACDKCKENGIAEFVVESHDGVRKYIDLLSSVDVNSYEHIVNFGNDIDEMMKNTVFGADITKCVVEVLNDVIINGKFLTNENFDTISECNDEVDTQTYSESYNSFPNEYQYKG